MESGFPGITISLSSNNSTVTDSTPPRPKPASAVFWNLLGSTFRRIATALSLPIVLRYVPADAYGAFQLLSSLFSLALIAIDFGLHSYFVRQQSTLDSSFFKVYWGAIFFNSAVGAILFFLIGIITSWNFLNSEIIFAISLFSLLVILSSLDLIISSHFVRDVQFQTLSFADSIYSVPNLILGIWCAFLWPTVTGLSFAFFISSLLKISYLLHAFQSWNYKGNIWTAIQDGLDFQIKNIRFLFFCCIGMFLSAISFSFPVFFFGLFYSTTSIAKFSLSLQLVGMPVNFLLTSISKVVFPLLAKGSLEKIRHGCSKLAFICSTIFFPILACCFLFSHIFVPIICGGKWVGLDRLVNLNTVPFIGSVISLPLMAIPTLVNSPEIYVWWSLGNSLTLAALLPLFASSNFERAILVYGIIRLGFMLYWQYLICKMVNDHFSNFIFRYLRNFPVLFILVVYWKILIPFAEQSLLLSFFLALSGFVFYILAIVTFFPKEFDDVSTIFPALRKFFKLDFIARHFRYT